MIMLAYRTQVLVRMNEAMCISCLETGVMHKVCEQPQ